ncbi:MAG: T9SS type A sorting domain-containing protein [Bacteroidales bacterium]|nr:T9SS type A sorting domain-containing protein [Bacteroidales bacterium]
MGENCLKFQISPPYPPPAGEIYLTTHYSIDISHLPNGIYFVKILTEKGMIIRKVVKCEL